MTFYNTIGHQGQELQEAKAITSKQDKLVIKIVKENQGRSLTARVIWSLTPVRAQLTSIRRSITNLVEAGHLEYGEKIKHVCPVDQFETTERLVKLPTPPQAPRKVLTLFD